MGLPSSLATFLACKADLVLPGVGAGSKDAEGVRLCSSTPPGSVLHRHRKPRGGPGPGRPAGGIFSGSAFPGQAVGGTYLGAKV